MKSKKGFQTMEDEKIVELYLLRNEEALGASKVKYGRMLLGLSQALLWNREDSEECENDTYLTAWNRIPPDRPSFLGAYLSKIVRYLSLNLLRKRNAGNGQHHDATHQKRFPHNRISLCRADGSQKGTPHAVKP